MNSVNRKRGVALLMVMTILSVMMILMSDLMYSSKVNLELARNAYFDLKASYYAKSAATLGLVILKADNILDTVMKKYGDVMGGGKKGSSPVDSHSDLWKQFSGMKLTQTTDFLKLMFKDDSQEGPEEGDDGGAGIVTSEEGDDSMQTQGTLFATDFIAELKDDDADITFEISDESKLININALQVKNLKTIIKMLFQRILGGRAESAFLDDKGVSIDTIVNQMVDWIDPNNEAVDGSGENDPYNDFIPRYQVQNAPFDTIEQIRLLACVDDDLFNLLAPFITIYPRDSGLFSINANTLSRDQLLTFFPELQENMKEIDSFYQRKIESKQPYFASVVELKEKLSQFGVNTEDKDVKTMLKYFKVNSTFYRIKATGEVGDVSRTLTMVVERSNKANTVAPPKVVKKPDPKDAKGVDPAKAAAASEASEDGETPPSDDETGNPAVKKKKKVSSFPFKILYWKMER